MGLGRPSSAGGHAVWSLTAWTPARGEVQSSGQSCGPEAGLHAQAAPPGTCHQLKVPRHDHNGTASERVTSYHCGPHVTPGNSRLRRVETASGLHPSPSGPGALPWRIQGFGSLAGAATGVQTGRWSVLRCWGRRHRTRREGGRREPGGQRWAGVWRAEVGGAAPEQPPDRTELLGNLPGPSWCPRRAGRGSRAPGRQALSGCGWK